MDVKEGLMPFFYTEINSLGEAFLETREKKKNIPIFVAHRGCPNDCVFCNQVKISGIKDEINPDKIKKIIEDSLPYCDYKNTQIAFFGGSFTGIEESVMIKYLEIAKHYTDAYSLDGIRLSTRPDYISPHILEILKAYGVKVIELGVQSMADDVLLKNNRGMSCEDTKNACRLIKEYGFSLGVQLMTSMYGSTSEDDIKTAIEAVNLNPDFVRIYPTVVIEGTKLYEFYKNGIYKTKTLEETVDICCKMLEIFTQANIPVIRLGLMTNEDINCENVIGAYHPAFGELVFSKFYFNKICKMIKEKGLILKDKILIIKAPKELVSKISGHKKENIQKLKEAYNIKDIHFKYDEIIDVLMLEIKKQ